MFRKLAAVLVLTLAPFTVSAQWVAGTHYQVIADAQNPRDDGKIEVVEAFWYGCPSCYSFEPFVKRWAATKADDVEFVRIAASMMPAWRPHARAYYTAEALGGTDKVHDQIFRAIHLERKPLNNPAAIGEVFTAHAGIDSEAFLKAYNSFGVETRMRRGDATTRKYRLSGVPTIVVNGRYITDPGKAQGYDKLIELINHLVELERRRMATAER